MLASARSNLIVWSRGVTRWFRCSLAVTDPFVCRCLNSWTMLPSSHPAHRTGYADFPLPALGEKGHEVAHGRWRVRWVRRTRPSTSYRDASENRLVPDITLCLAHNHWRSLLQAWLSTKICNKNAPEARDSHYLQSFPISVYTQMCSLGTPTRL